MRMTESGNEAVTDPAATDGIAADEQLNAQVSAPAVPFGEWPSPVTAAEIASAPVTGSFPTILGSDAWWQQGLPDEGGRTTVMHSSGGKQTALLSAPWNARTRVHEYGGLAYLPIPRSALAGKPGAKQARGYQILFANFADQRLYLSAPGRQPASAVPPRTVPLRTSRPRSPLIRPPSRPHRAKERSAPEACGTPISFSRTTAVRSGACKSGTRAARSAGPSWQYRWTVPRPTIPRRSGPW